MARHYSHRSSGDQAKNSHHDERYDRQNDYYEPNRPARRRPSGGDYWSSGSSSGSSPSRRFSGGLSRRQSASGGFLARRSMSSTSLSRYSSPMSSIDEFRCSDWETDMERYFHSLRQDNGDRREFDPIVGHPDIRHDRQARGYLHRGEYVANQFDVTLPYVRDLLHHMYDRYNTVTCYSLGLLKAGDIIYYIEPFVLGFDQMDEGQAIEVLGGSRFQAAVKAKGRFGIVTHKIGRQTLKVAPMYTFNGEGLASRPPSVRDEYTELGLQGNFTWDWTKPNMSPMVEKVFCPLKAGSAVHLATSRVTLSSQILLAGSITPHSLDLLRSAIVLAEVSAGW
ncbi:hypothetical protein PMIN04_009092 [Paraphaeosphaeria minitans]